MAPRVLLCHCREARRSWHTSQQGGEQALSDRIIIGYLEGNPVLIVVVAYAPNEAAITEEKADFYDKLQDAIESIPHHNVIVMTSDFNARIGQDSHITNPGIIGTYTYYDSMNTNGELLASFCEHNNLRPTQLRFPQPKHRMLAWEHTSGQHAQLDHIINIINGKWLNSARNCRAYRTVELGSDCRIVSVTIKISLRI